MSVSPRGSLAFLLLLEGFLSAVATQWGNIAVNDWNWTALGTIATFLAVLFALFSHIWEYHWKTPKLSLHFDQTDVKPQEPPTTGLPPGIYSKWVRVRVRNKDGCKVAKNCRAYLVGITNEPGFAHDSRALKWEHIGEQQSTYDLHSGEVHRVFVIGAWQGLDVLRCSTTPLYVIKSLGKHVLTIRVSAEEATSQEISIEIEWDGTNWQSLTAVEVPHPNNLPASS